MNRIRIVFAFLKYWIIAKNKHGIHSPFVYELLTKTISSKEGHKDFNAIERLRYTLRLNTQKIEVSDLGAGSQINTAQIRSVQDIAKNSLKSKKYGQLIYRIVNRFQSKRILELGTSLGITSIYIAKANPLSQFTTIEGCPEIAQIAQKNFTEMDCKNIDVKVGNFDKTLPEYLTTNSILDLVFFDGNHRKKPTLDYFEQCKQHINNDSVFIFDDIYWSKEMVEAWNTIKRDPQVTVTIDLFFLGIVFFRKEQKKENFIIRY